MNAYRVVRGGGEGWRIEINGTAQGDYATKEAAFEACAGAASNDIKRGQGIRIEVEGRDSGEAALGRT